MKYLILVTFFWANTVFAEDFRVGKVDENFSIGVKSNDHLKTIFVKKENKEIFKYESDLVTQKPLKFGLVKFNKKKQPHLITVWTSGAHGQELIIFDLEKYNEKDKEAAIVYLYGSAWTIDMDINQERIVIKGNKEIDPKTKLPVKEELTFRP